MDMFYRQIIAPWCNLLDWWNNIDTTTTSSTAAGENETSSQLASALILYDFSTFLKVLVHRNDPDFFTRSIFSFGQGGPGAVTDFHIIVPSSEVARVRTEARMGIGHVPEDADRLIKLNRKFLIWHNLSDQTLSPYMSINYYKKLAKLHGGYANLQRNVRLFGLPGTPHCGMGGVGPNTFDALTAMENWVEKGIAPDALTATLYPTSGPYHQKDVSQPPGRTN